MQQRCRPGDEHRRDTDPGFYAHVAELAWQHCHKEQLHGARDQLDAVQPLLLGAASRQQYAAAALAIADAPNDAGNSLGIAAQSGVLVAASSAPV